MITRRYKSRPPQATDPFPTKEQEMSRRLARHIQLLESVHEGMPRDVTSAKPRIQVPKGREDTIGPGKFPEPVKNQPAGKAILDAFVNSVKGDLETGGLSAIGPPLITGLTKKGLKKAAENFTNRVITGKYPGEYFGYIARGRKFSGPFKTAEEASEWIKNYRTSVEIQKENADKYRAGRAASKAARLAAKKKGK